MTTTTGYEYLFVAPLLILGVIFLVATAMMPIYVYRISINTQKQNKLLRQLIKAYGHEPEA